MMKSKHLKGLMTDLHVMIFLINTISYLYFNYKRSDLAGFFSAMLTGHLLLCLFLYNGSNQKEFLFNAQKAGAMPVKRIKKANGLYFFALILLGAAATVICLELFNRGAGEMLRNILQRILHEIFALFFDTAALGTDETIVQFQKELIDAGSAPGDRSFSYMDILQSLLVAAGILLLIRILFISQIPDARAGIPGDGSESLLRESEDAFSGERRKAKDKLNFFAKNNNERVRKSYICHIKKINRKRKPIIGSMTSSEIEAHLSVRESEENEWIRSLYHKARYSDHIISNDEAAQMKEMVRKNENA